MKESQTNWSNIINNLIRTYNLGYVLNNLESIITLPIPYKDLEISMKEYEYNKKMAIESISNTESTYLEFLQEYNIRKSVFDNIRNFNPDFCSRIDKTLTAEEYNEYLELLKKCTKNISTLLHSLHTNNNVHNYKELLLEDKDYISSIVDSESTSKITYLQDKFVLNELDSLNPTYLSKMDSTIIKNIQKIKKELAERILKYENFQKLYATKNVIHIKASKDKERD